MGFLDIVADAVFGQVLGQKASTAKIAMEMFNQ
jgi:hypothetical protein